MSTGEYLAGAVFFLLMLGGVVAGTTLLTQKRLTRLAGVERIVAWGLIASLGVLAVHVVPMLFGIMDRWTVVIASAIFAVIAWRVPALPAAEPDRPPPPAQPSGTAAWVLSGLALAGVSLFVLFWARSSFSAPSIAIDWLVFHMPGVAAWMHTGSLWQIDNYLPDLAPGNYPGNGDVMFLATTLPWTGDFLAHFAIYPFLVLTSVATYALAAELRAPRAAAAGAAAALASIPVVLQPTLSGGLVDAVMLFGFATGMLFLIRHARNGRTSELVLAGLALGLSFGTKWYAVSSVAIVMAVWLVAMLIARRPIATVARQTAALSGLIALGGGIWLLRNWVESSNPVFPVKVDPFGLTIFDAPRDVIREKLGFSLSHYFDQPDVWEETILPQLNDAVGAAAGLALLALIVTVVLLVIRRDRIPVPRVALAGAVCMFLLTCAYAITPYTAGGPEGLPLVTGVDSRYWVPALMVGLVLGAWAAGVWRRGPVVFSALAFLAMVSGVDQTREILNFNASKSDLASIVILCGGLAAVGIAAVPALLPLQGRSEKIALGALAAGAVVVALVAGSVLEDRFYDHRYKGLDKVVDALSVPPAAAGNKVGIVGEWGTQGFVPPLPAFGPRFENDVAYLGRPDKGLFRRFRTAPAFTAAVEKGGYDYLVIGQGKTVPAKRAPREEAWAKAAGYQLVARAPNMALYRRG